MEIRLLKSETYLVHDPDGNSRYECTETYETKDGVAEIVYPRVFVNGTFLSMEQKQVICNGCTLLVPGEMTVTVSQDIPQQMSGIKVTYTDLVSYYKSESANYLLQLLKEKEKNKKLSHESGKANKRYKTIINSLNRLISKLQKMQ